VRVILVDDANLVREGIARRLANEGVDVIAQLTEATGLLDAVRADPPDVVGLDVRMPPPTRPRACRRPSIAEQLDVT